MVGGPLILLAAAIAAVRSTLGAILDARRPSLPAAFGTVAVLLYAVPVRRWMRRWGALPGEGTAAEPVHAIEVEARAQTVWAWLAQIGPSFERSPLGPYGALHGGQRRGAPSGNGRRAVRRRTPPRGSPAREDEAQAGAA